MSKSTRYMGLASLTSIFLSTLAFAEPPIQAGDTLQSLSQLKVETTINGQPGSLAQMGLSETTIAQAIQQNAVIDLQTGTLHAIASSSPSQPTAPVTANNSLAPQPLSAEDASADAQEHPLAQLQPTIDNGQLDQQQAQQNTATSGNSSDQLAAADQQLKQAQQFEQNTANPEHKIEVTAQQLEQTHSALAEAQAQIDLTTAAMTPDTAEQQVDANAAAVDADAQHTDSNAAADESVELNDGQASSTSPLQ